MIVQPQFCNLINTLFEFYFVEIIKDVQQISGRSQFFYHTEFLTRDSRIRRGFMGLVKTSKFESLSHEKGLENRIKTAYNFLLENDLIPTNIKK